ncbi:nuclease, partial [Salmonella enterica subsp. enterica serovar Agona]
GADLERAGERVGTRLNEIEAHREQERAAQHEKVHDVERSQRQRTHNGPSL